MKIKLTIQKQFDVKYLKIDAQVRYWEGAEINGEVNESGKGVPFKNGDMWQPIIDIDSGIVVDWPENTEASFYFKVCDAGEYSLLDSDMNVIISKDGYVPDGLCHGGNGDGDYIIFKVGKDGVIENYTNKIDPDEWCHE